MIPVHQGPCRYTVITLETVKYSGDDQAQTDDTHPDNVLRGAVSKPLIYMEEILDALRSKDKY